MKRRVLLAVVASGAVTLAASFGVASHAFGSSEPPRLRPELPAAALPAFSLDEATSVTINNLIGAPAISRFGITEASYDQVRRLGVTSVGPFYLIPGSNGACLATTSAVACGDPGAAGEPMLALAEAMRPADPLVGVGITTPVIRHVVLERADGSSVTSLPVVAGIFRLDERVGASSDPAHGLRFVAG